MNTERIKRLESVAKILGYLGGGIAALGALLQYNINSQAEQRQQTVTELENDIKISALFSELALTASGYGGWSQPNAEIISALLRAIPPDLLVNILQREPKNIGMIFAGSMIPEPVPLAKQLAAAESIPTLAIKYPVLLEPALVGLDLATYTVPQAKHAYERLTDNYNFQRPLVNWSQSVDLPDPTLRRQLQPAN